jgi:UDP-sulfoquinovose synthase
VGARAREELGGICPIGHPLDTDSPVGGFEPGGGQDFARFVGLEAALKLYQQLGLKAARAQSFKLASQLAAGLSEIFSEVEHQLLPSSPGMVAIRFDRLDPYPLYQKLEANKVHVKCIKGATPSGLWLNQLRFGVPWYETPARLEQALSIIRSQYAAG